VYVAFVKTFSIDIAIDLFVDHGGVDDFHDIVGAFVGGLGEKGVRVRLGKGKG
jgi:hypothetical protein